MPARGGDPHPQPASLVVRDVAELLAHGTPLSLEVLGIGEELLAGIGESERHRALEEPHPQLALHGGDVRREGLLRHVEPLGRLGETSLLGDGDDVVHGVEVHGGFPSPRAAIRPSWH